MRFAARTSLWCLTSLQQKTSPLFSDGCSTPGRCIPCQRARGFSGKLGHCSVTDLFAQLVGLLHVLLQDPRSRDRSRSDCFLLSLWLLQHERFNVRVVLSLRVCSPATLTSTRRHVGWLAVIDLSRICGSIR